MAQDDDGPVGTDEKIRRSVARTLATWLVVLASLGVIGGWAATGLYELQPGEAAVMLRFGSFDRTVTEPGLRWHLPSPLESIARVNLSEIRREKFGLVQGKDPTPGEETATSENAMQTGDSNIVNLSYEVQYRLQDAFTYVYGMAHPEAILRDAAQASVREVVGRTSVDGVLSEERASIQREAREILQATLDSYVTRDSGHQGPFEIESINLLIVQPPTPVQAAFDDVTSAQQDEARALSVARGDAKEISERANAQAIELRQAAEAYKAVQILEATGRASRFEAMYAEYRRAPEVTRTRLYLETMEEVLPEAEKLIVEPGAVSVMPFLPLQGRADGARRSATTPAVAGGASAATSAPSPPPPVPTVSPAPGAAPAAGATEEAAAPAGEEAR